ncbi:MAG: spore coat protein YlbD [bacterium]|nr:spore coat protein YlbD [bacterium]
MDKKENFKEFVKTRPNLINKVKNKETSWQELYEIYDLYGEDEAAWNKYEEDESRASSLSELTSLVKNINMDSVQKYINNAQKAINVIQELTNKPVTEAPKIIPKTPRPLNKFFGD